MKYRITGTNYVNGYKILHVPDHPKTNEGWQYEHIILMEEELGRLLESGEEVHHLDGNRGNNRTSNLVVMSKEHHARTHKWLERDSINLKKYQRSPECVVCGITLQGKQTRCCSLDCERVVREDIHEKSGRRPPKEDLIKLIQIHPFTKIGELFGVSDNAVRKWCKTYSIPHRKKDINKLGL